MRSEQFHVEVFACLDQEPWEKFNEVLLMLFVTFQESDQAWFIQRLLEIFWLIIVLKWLQLSWGIFARRIAFGRSIILTRRSTILFGQLLLQHEPIIELKSNFINAIWLRILIENGGQFGENPAAHVAEVHIFGVEPSSQNVHRWDNLVRIILQKKNKMADIVKHDIIPAHEFLLSHIFHASETH